MTIISFQILCVHVQSYILLKKKKRFTYDYLKYHYACFCIMKKSFQLIAYFFNVYNYNYTFSFYKTKSIII